MAKGMKIALFSGLCALLIGAIVFFVGFAAGGFRWAALSNTKTELLTFEEGTNDELSSVHIDYEHAAVHVCFDDTAERVTVAYPQLQSKKGKNLSNLTLTNENGALKITERVHKWRATWWDFTSPRVTITLPSARAYDIVVTTESGDVVVEGKGNARTLLLSTDNGKVTTESAELTCSGSLTAKAENGNLRLGKIVCERLDARTDNGDIFAANALDVSETAAFETDNGKVRFSSTVHAKSVSVRTDNGSITTTDEGAIDATTLLFSADNGNVRLTLAATEKDYAVNVKTENGKSNIQTSIGNLTATRTLQIETDNGNVQVHFLVEG